MPPGPAAAAPPPDWLMMPDHGARHEDCPYPSPFAALCYACLFVVLDVLLALSVRKLVKPDKPFIPSWITHTKGNRSTAKPRNARRSHRSRTRTPGRPAKPRKHNPNAYLEYWPSTFPPCGQLCEPRGPSLYDSVAGKLTVTRGRFYPQVFVPVNCTALFAYRPQRLHVNLSHLLALYESTAAFDPMLWTDPFVRRVIDRQVRVQSPVKGVPGHRRGPGLWNTAPVHAGGGDDCALPPPPPLPLGTTPLLSTTPRDIHTHSPSSLLVFTGPVQ